MASNANASSPSYAVNDAVSALTDLVRSLRATAKAAKKPAGRGAHKGHSGKNRNLRTRLEHAWEVFAHGNGQSANGRAAGDDGAESSARGGRSQRRAGGGRASRGRAAARGGRAPE